MIQCFSIVAMWRWSSEYSSKLLIEETNSEIYFLNGYFHLSEIQWYKMLNYCMRPEVFNAVFK